jgi:phosphoribosylglycinamide formyltransferase-1
MVKDTHNKIRANPSIGILTYDFFHLKTEQIVHQLLRKGFKDITLFALPYTQRPERAVLIPHRPNQTDAITTKELANANDLSFIRYDGKSELAECDFYLITGAGLLPSNVVRGKQIINAHPGIIPSARGLDSFKWSIYENIPLGITLHYIDEEVDAGQLISIVRTPIYPGDSLMTLARRHYELEIEVLSNFTHYLANSFIEAFPIYDAHRRMPAEIEAEMVRRFDNYKLHFAKSTPQQP